MVNLPKILFCMTADVCNYSIDTLFHGLVSIGAEVTDPLYASRMCTGGNLVNPKFNTRTFSLYWKLPERLDIDRSRDSILKRIADRYYDIVVFGQGRSKIDFMDEVLEVYPREKVAYIDGSDHESDTRVEFVKKLRYFKRHPYIVHVNDGNVIPISYSIPKEMFMKRCDEKLRDFAPQLPGHPGLPGSVYLYKDEDEYYRSYGESYFAFTWRKGGWDSLRHYEIVASGAVPVFPDIDYIPPQTMITWPRELQRRANMLAYKWATGYRDLDEYRIIHEEFKEYGTKHLTTESAARYFLDKMGIGF